MEVILLEQIHGLGKIGDCVKVKPGYGRNYLLPKGHAVRATQANLAEIEAKRAALEKAAQAQVKVSQGRQEKLGKLAPVIIRARVSADDKLFGSVSVSDIAQAVTGAGVELAKSEVRLPGGPIRLVGEYTVDVQLPGEVDAAVNIVVAPGEE